jgi:hypothetical protein
MPVAGAACAGTARNPSTEAAKAVTSELARLILSMLLLRGVAKPCVGKCCRREFLLPGMVNCETHASRLSSAARPQSNLLSRAAFDRRWI